MLDTIKNSIIPDTISGVLSGIITLAIPVIWYQFSNQSFSDFLTFKRKTMHLKDNKKKFPARRYFKVGSKPDRENQRITDFLSNGIIAIGWPDITGLEGLVDKPSSDIRDIIAKELKEHYPKENNKTRSGQIAGYFVKLLSMKEGDIILTPVHKTLYIFEVTQPYTYKKELADKSMAHTVGINKHSVLTYQISDLSPVTFPPKFKRVFQVGLSIISLDEYSEQIEKLI